MNRRGFLRNLGMLPAAAFLPSISVARAATVAPALSQWHGTGFTTSPNGLQITMLRTQFQCF